MRDKTDLARTQLVLGCPSMGTVYAVADVAAQTDDMERREHSAARTAALLVLDLLDRHPAYMAAVLSHHHQIRSEQYEDLVGFDADVLQRTQTVMAEAPVVPLPPVR